MKKYYTDFLFMLSSLLTLALFAVSAPATFELVSAFHSNGSETGWYLALVLMLSLELGAIGCKIATVRVPEWTRKLNRLTIMFLAMTTVANYALGADYISMARLSPTLSGWFSIDAVRILATVVYAATVPVFLYTFLDIAVTRFRQLQGSTASLVANVDRVQDEMQVALLETAQNVNRLVTVALQRLEQSHQALASANAPQAPMLTNETVIDKDDIDVMDVVRWRDVDGLTFEQIGLQLGISRQAAQQRYYRAKK